MKTKVIIEAAREGYSTSQIRYTITVGELISVLSDYDDDAEVYLSFDGGYTYGSIDYRSFTEEPSDSGE